MTSTYLQADFGAAVSIGCICLGNTNLSAAGTWRIRLSANADMSSPGYDSTAVAAGVDPAFRLAVLFLASPVSRRYLRVDLSDGSLPHLEAGRLFAGAAFKPVHNFQFGAKREYPDQSRRFQSESGNDYVLRGSIRRAVAFTLPAVTTAEWEATLEPLLRLSGTSADVLVCLDPASSNLGRDTYLGLLDEIPAYEMNFPGHGTTSFRLAHRI